MDRIVYISYNAVFSINTELPNDQFTIIQNTFLKTQSRCDLDDICKKKTIYIFYSVLRTFFPLDFPSIEFLYSTTIRRSSVNQPSDEVAHQCTKVMLENRVKESKAPALYRDGKGGGAVHDGDGSIPGQAIVPLSSRALR